MAPKAESVTRGRVSTKVNGSTNSSVPTGGVYNRENQLVPVTGYKSMTTTDLSNNIIQQNKDPVIERMLAFRKKFPRTFPN